MLYLTRRNTEYTPLYSAHISLLSETVLVDRKLRNTKMVIIDIDPIDACALVLKGEPLFPVVHLVETGNRYSFYDHEAIMQNFKQIYDCWLLS